MGTIEVLDCTLREGGYLNNRDFGVENIKSIIHNLEVSQIEYIECGYLKSVKFNPDIALYDSIKTFENFVGKHNSKLVLMINYGEYLPKELPQDTFLRIAFKKKNFREALDYCKELKGFKIFINPMHTNFYTDSELKELVRGVNEILPYGFTITDSTGSMTECDLSNIFKAADNLDEKIKLCFHSHNNLQLSFSNSRYFINHYKNRDIIIDSTLSGIGRGGGNLSTEVIAEYLNNSFDKNYKKSKILDTTEKYIKPFSREKTSQIPYFISAMNKCHPNYAKFLIEKSIPHEKMDEILKSIPETNKVLYDEDLINELVVKFSKLKGII